MNPSRFIAVGLALVAATPAFAHPLSGDAGLAGGFAHPFSGWDHLLAMTALGLLIGSTQKRFAAILLAFVAALGAGFVLGVKGLHMPMVEPGILASMMVFGLLTAVAAKLPVSIAAPLIAAFTVFHGHAHGTEAPAGAAQPRALWPRAS